MKTIKNFIEGRPSGEVVGQIINVVFIICGLSILVFGVAAQVINKVFEVNLFQLF